MYVYMYLSRAPSLSLALLVSLAFSLAFPLAPSLPRSRSLSLSLPLSLARARSPSLPFATQHSLSLQGPSNLRLRSHFLRIIAANNCFFLKSKNIFFSWSQNVAFVFWQGPSRLSNWDNVEKQIEKGESKIQKRIESMNALQMKVDKYPKVCVCGCVWVSAHICRIA